MATNPKAKKALPELRPFDPDLITIRPARKRKAKAPIAARDVYRPDIFAAWARGERLTTATTPPPKPGDTPPPPKEDDPVANVRAHWWYAILKHREVKVLDCRRLYGYQHLGEDSSAMSPAIRQAQREADAAFEALLRTPAPTLELHSYKRHRDLGRGTITQLRKSHPEWAKLLDDEEARLRAETAQRQAEKKRKEPV